MTCDVVPMKCEGSQGRSTWTTVFEDFETAYYSYPDGWCYRSLDEPPRNPKYREELQLNLSNRNMGILIAALGYEISSDGLMVPIREFLQAATFWLQENIGKKSEGFDSDHVGGRGARFIEGGLREGYVNEKMYKAVVIAREGLARGATHLFLG